MSDIESGIDNVYYVLLIERHATKLDLEHLPNGKTELEEQEICESCA